MSTSEFSGKLPSRVPVDEDECRSLIEAVLMNDLACLSGKGSADQAIACLQSDEEHYNKMLEFIKNFRRELLAQEKILLAEKNSDAEFNKKFARLQIMKNVATAYKENIKKLRIKDGNSG